MIFFSLLNQAQRNRDWWRDRERRERDEAEQRRRARSQEQRDEAQQKLGPVKAIIIRMPDFDKIRAERLAAERRDLVKLSSEEIERQRASIVVTDNNGNVDRY